MKALCCFTLITLLNFNMIYSQVNNQQLIHNEIFKETNSKIEVYKVQKPNNKLIIRIIISVMNPSALGEVNYLGEGIVYLIVPETIDVDYNKINIKFATSANSETYYDYEVPSSTTKQLEKIGTYISSLIPYIGQVIGASALLAEEKNSFNYFNAKDLIDRNTYDAVDVIWFVKVFKYYQKVKIEIPIESTDVSNIGIYANWATKATDETVGPIFTRDNKSYPGFSLKQIEGENNYSVSNTLISINDYQYEETNFEGIISKKTLLGRSVWTLTTKEVYCTDQNNKNEYNVFQLIGKNDFGRYNNKKVKIVGQPFWWHTQYHVTKILINVKQIKVLN